MTEISNNEWENVNRDANAQEVFETFKTILLHVQREMPGGSLVQCLACDVKVASSILVHSSFLVTGSALIN